MRYEKIQKKIGFIGIALLLLLSQASAAELDGGCFDDIVNTSPYVGLPFFNAGAWGYSTFPTGGPMVGQMPFSLPVMIATRLSWYGAQPYFTYPTGASSAFMSPMGLNTIAASQAWDAITPHYSGQTAE